MRDVEIDFDMIDIDCAADGNRVQDIIVIEYRFGRRAGGADRDFVRAGALRGPAFRQADRGVRIDQTETEIVTCMEAAAVPVIGAVIFPAGIAHVDLARGIGEDFLDVAIAKQRIGFQHERDDAGGNRRRRRGAAERKGKIAARVPAGPGAVRRRDAGRPTIARRAEQNGGAGRAVETDIAGILDRRDRDRFPRVLKTVIVDVLTRQTVVAGGP